MQDEERQFAAEHVPDAAHRSGLVVTAAGGTRHEHLGRHFATQTPRLSVAVDPVTRHVDRPARTTRVQMRAGAGNRVVYKVGQKVGPRIRGHNSVKY